ncbi:hypothetical protein KQH81_05060 [Clostridium cadaveris]|nr:hypothetical protein [Clostridium cadaveris]UFH65904.1 hypothetical protein KQH81_05060 [Clostridium cadaveris]
MSIIILNDEYLRLYEKLKDLKKEQEYFESLYNSKLGALIFLREELKELY